MPTPLAPMTTILLPMSPLFPVSRSTAEMTRSEPGKSGRSGFAPMASTTTSGCTGRSFRCSDLRIQLDSHPVLVQHGLEVADQRAHLGRLFGDCGGCHELPAEAPIAFHQGHMVASHGRGEGTLHARRSAAYDEDIAASCGGP